MPTVLITGANRGLGLEFVRQYTADQWNVIACCRAPERADALQALAKENAAVQIEKIDISDDQSIAALSEKLSGVAIDVLINNAGILSGENSASWGDNADDGQVFGSLNSKAWAQVLATNSIAPVMLSQALLPQLKQRENAKIVMISSEAASITNMSKIGHVAYRTSKAALNSAMRNMAFTLENAHIVVVSLHPGWVQTDMGGRQAAITPSTSVEGMRSVIAKLTRQQSGKFLDYKGNDLPW